MAPTPKVLDDNTGQCFLFLNESFKSYVVATKLNRLIETVQIRDHNIYF